MQRYAWQIVQGLIGRGYRVTVFVRSDEHGLGLHGADVQAVLHGSVAEDAERLRSWATRVDLWHAMNAGYAWLSGHPVPSVVSVYGNDFLLPWIPVDRRNLPLLGSRINHQLRLMRSQKLLGKSCPKADRILAISQYSKRIFLERHPECWKTIRVVYGGVDPAWLRVPRASHRERQPVRLMTVCRLEDPRKNVHLVLNALARLSRRYSFEYSIAGDGPIRPELQDLAKKIGIAERVRFLGHLEDSELVSRLAETDLFVLVSSRNPASFEGFGLVYLEAGAVGTPVLAAKLGGAPEAVNEGTSGFFADASVGGIEAALSRFLSGSIRFDAATCRAHAAQFTWNATVDAVESTYREALEEWSRRRP